VPSLFTYTPGPTIVLPSASSAPTVNGIAAAVPAAALVAVPAAMIGAQPPT
jgi:hypothetical protein